MRLAVPAICSGLMLVGSISVTAAHLEPRQLCKRDPDWPVKASFDEALSRAFNESEITNIKGALSVAVDEVTDVNREVFARVVSPPAADRLSEAISAMYAKVTARLHKAIDENQESLKKASNGAKRHEILSKIKNGLRAVDAETKKLRHSTNEAETDDLAIHARGIPPTPPPVQDSEQPSPVWQPRASGCDNCQCDSIIKSAFNNPHGNLTEEHGACCIRGCTDLLDRELVASGVRLWNPRAFKFHGRILPQVTEKEVIPRDCSANCPTMFSKHFSNHTFDINREHGRGSCINWCRVTTYNKIGHWLPGNLTLDYLIQPVKDTSDPYAGPLPNPDKCDCNDKNNQITPKTVGPVYYFSAVEKTPCIKYCQIKPVPSNVPAAKDPANPNALPSNPILEHSPIEDSYKVNSIADEHDNVPVTPDLDEQNIKREAKGPLPTPPPNDDVLLEDEDVNEPRDLLPVPSNEPSSLSKRDPKHRKPKPQEIYHACSCDDVRKIMYELEWIDKEEDIAWHNVWMQWNTDCVDKCADEATLNMTWEEYYKAFNSRGP